MKIIRFYFRISNPTQKDILRYRIETNQTVMQAVQRIHDDDTTSNFESAITVKSYDTTNSDDHRKEQFANLQHIITTNYLSIIFNGK